MMPAAHNLWKMHAKYLVKTNTFIVVAGHNGQLSGKFKCGGARHLGVAHQVVGDWLADDLIESDAAVSAPCESEKRQYCDSKNAGWSRIRAGPICAVIWASR